MINGDYCKNQKVKIDEINNKLIITSFQNKSTPGFYKCFTILKDKKYLLKMIGFKQSNKNEADVNQSLSLSAARTPLIFAAWSLPSKAN